MSESQQFIESLKVTNENHSLNRVYKVPTAEIEFDSFLPTRWGVEYVQLSDEADELEAFILGGNNYLIEGDKGLGKTQAVLQTATHGHVTIYCGAKSCRHGH